MQIKLIFRLVFLILILIPVALDAIAQIKIDSKTISAPKNTLTTNIATEESIRQDGVNYKVIRDAYSTKQHTTDKIVGLYNGINIYQGSGQGDWGQTRVYLQNQNSGRVGLADGTLRIVLNEGYSIEQLLDRYPLTNERFFSFTNAYHVSVASGSDTINTYKSLTKDKAVAEVSLWIADFEIETR